MLRYLIILIVFLPILVSAGEIDDLKGKINEHGDRIQELEKEIEKYQVQIEETQKEANTLNSAIKTLDITRNQLSTDINITQNRINSTTLNIQQLEIEIIDKEDNIVINRIAISSALRRLDRIESDTLIEILLNNDRLSDFWMDMDSLQQFQKSVRAEVDILRGVKRNLAASVVEREGRKNELSSYRTELTDKKKIVDINKSEKDSLLTETKNKESNYKSILDEKLRQKEEFERELQEFEDQLRVAIDPSSIPQKGSSVFRWPLERFTVTQLFGNTYFAKQNPNIYGDRAYHPGIDLGATTGTVIKAPLSGTVRMVGNTDSVRGCYSWGKWTLIEHNNGLSTLYAHQSLIKVSQGQKVSTGDIIGYVGSTGYSTGPHLHFTVYATKGVSIVPFEKIRSTTKCAGLLTPVAPSNAYLDPMDYLPN